MQPRDQSGEEEADDRGAPVEPVRRCETPVAHGQQQGDDSQADRPRGMPKVLREERSPHGADLSLVEQLLEDVIPVPPVRRGVEEEGRSDHQGRHRGQCRQSHPPLEDGQDQQHRHEGQEVALFRHEGEKRHHAHHDPAADPTGLAAQVKGKQEEEERHCVNPADVEPGTTHGEGGGEQPARYHSRHHVTRLAPHDRHEQDAGAQGADERDESQRQEPDARQMREGSGDPEVQRCVRVGNVVDRRRDVDRLPVRHAASDLHRSTLEPFELVGIPDPAQSDKDEDEGRHQRDQHDEHPREREASPPYGGDLVHPRDTRARRQDRKASSALNSVMLPSTMSKLWA